MKQYLKVELQAKDPFWSHAFLTEWEHQFPDRFLEGLGDNYFALPAEWLPDLKRVAEQCFCDIILAPENPHRRNWIRSFIPKI